MTSLPRQLTLDWPHRPSFAREDFLPAASNREALRTIDLWPGWAGRTLLLMGPAGSGKSHLAAIWAAASEAESISEGELAAPRGVEIGRDALLIEDADRLESVETPLFHVLNDALHRSAWVLMTARSTPDNWGFRTPDLLSRLRLAPVVSLEAPDMDLTEAVLFKLFSDRQLQVEPRVVSYIALRIERSLGAARAFVDALDREALARGSRVSRRMAAELLEKMGAALDSP